MGVLWIWATDMPVPISSSESYIPGRERFYDFCVKQTSKVVVCLSVCYAVGLTLFTILTSYLWPL